MPATIWVLVIAQALAMSAPPLFVFVGSIIGNDLAPRAGLATLPVALVIVGTALSVVPVTRLMQRCGRKRIFIAGASLAAVAALGAATAVALASFTGLAVAAVLIGIAVAIAQQYRFAALEAVAPSLAGSAVSRLMLGGLLAAYLGPELVIWGSGLGAELGMQATHSAHQPFIGAFLLLALLSTLGLLVLLLGFTDAVPETVTSDEPGRPLTAILANPLIWLAIIASAMGYAMMSFLMTATPLNMHSVNGHSLADTKWVIQAHVVAMFAPSFISGWLIHTFGHRKVIALGVAAYILSLLVAHAGVAVSHYGWALVLLGIGWNFMFVSGTALLPLCHTVGERFRVQTANEFAVFGCQALAALSSGWIVQRFGWDTLLAIGAVMVSVVLAALWINRSAPLAVDTTAG